MSAGAITKKSESVKPDLLHLRLHSEKDGSQEVSFNGEGHLTVGSILRAISPGTLSNLSVDDHGHLRVGRSNHLSIHDQTHASTSPGPPLEKKGMLRAFWVRNKGLALVLMAQVFNCLMNVATRLLEVEGNGGKGFHPLQILFVRMGITVAIASTYMWTKNIEHFPFGAKGVRLLLMARGFGGFFGVFGMYYSLLYLPLADATVITFLSPVIACAACAYIIKEPFTRMEQVAAFLSLMGVVLIARPTAIFSYFQDVTAPPASGTSEHAPLLNATQGASDAGSYANVTPAQQAMAVGVALMGVLGGATVITTLRWIGKRAHPLITVNYFATWVVVVSGVSSALIPSIGFAMPSSLTDWGYLFFLGTCGFTSQFLGAAGLQYEKSSRETNMVYTQMLFALAMDKLIFGHSPELLSIIGSSLILGSAIFVALRKEVGAATAPNVDIDYQQRLADEERGLVDGMDADDGDSDIPMQEVTAVRTV